MHRNRLERGAADQFSYHFLYSFLAMKVIKIQYQKYLFYQNITFACRTKIIMLASNFCFPCLLLLNKQFYVSLKLPRKLLSSGKKKLFVTLDPAVRINTKHNLKLASGTEGTPQICKHIW